MLLEGHKGQNNTAALINYDEDILKCKRRNCILNYLIVHVVLTLTTVTFKSFKTTTTKVQLNNIVVAGGDVLGHILIGVIH